MANPLKGEVDFPAGGKSYTLCFTTDAIVKVEQLLGKEISEISSSASVGNIRAMLWAGLLSHEPTIDLIAASSVLDDYEGGVMQAFEQIVRALRFRLARTPIDAPLDDDNK